MDDLIQRAMAATRNARSFHYLLIQPATRRIFESEQGPELRKMIDLAMAHLDNDIHFENFREYLQRCLKPDSIAFLREKAQQCGIPNYSRMCKEELILALQHYYEKHPSGPSNGHGGKRAADQSNLAAY